MKKVFLVLVLFFASAVYAMEYPVEEWGGFNAGVESIRVDASDSVYALGWTGLTKLNSQGSIVWFRPEIVLAAGVNKIEIVVNGGYVYVVGNCSGIGSCTAKLDTDGNIIWQAMPGGMGINIDAQGNVYVVESGYMIKYDQSGNMLWSVSNPITPWGGVVIDNSGNAYTTGYAGTVAFDPNGNMLWSREAFFCNYAFGYGCNYRILTDSTGVYVSGDGGVQKFDFSGNQLWVAPVLNGIDMVKGTNNDIYVAGARDYNCNSWGCNSDIAAAKLGIDGTILWYRYLELYQNDYDFAISLAVDPAGNAYVAGNSYPGIMLKFGADGKLLWYKWRQQSGDARDVEIGPTGDIYISGSFDTYGVMKYSELSYERYILHGFLPPVSNGTIKRGQKIPVKFLISDPTGNPATSATPVLYMQQLGGEPTELGNMSFSINSGYYEIKWDTEGLATTDWILKVCLDDGSSYTQTVTITE